MRLTNVYIMKILLKFPLARLLTGGLIVPVVVSMLPAQAQSVAPVAEKNARFADGVVATVGNRKITRRDVVATYAAYEPKIIGEALLNRYPQLDRAMTLDMDSLCRSAFASGTVRFENVVERLMVLNALEEAAARRGIEISAEEVDAQTHRDLNTRRKGLRMPEAPDEELARKLGDNLVLLRRTAREILLRKRLILKDLNDRLGHPLGKDDYYSVHALFTRVNDARGVFLPEATLEKIQRQRAAILAKQQAFEDVARAESQDASRARGGAFGPLPHKLLKNEIDAALMKLQPDEITQPIEILGGYAIFRLDKRGQDLTEAERKTALAVYMSSEKRSQNAVALAVQTIPWSTTIGKAPEWLKLSDEANNASATIIPSQAASGEK